MRIGEVCGLRWCDVDFETGLISIRHSVAYAKGMGSLFKTFSETNGLMGTNDELITFHGLRHTFATQWIRQGGDIKALQSILGHKDAMATLNVYADIEPISKIHNMLRATPCLWRGHLGPRVRGMRRGTVSPTEGRGCPPLPVRNQPSEAFG
ncbi:MAG: site-specific integrase [Collinsella sp.]|nr:site-specific integrase [Collinsella sp.]